MTTKVCLVIPTYNEADNIAQLLHSLEAVFTDLPEYEADILVADDTSPDGTAQIVTELTSKYANIQLLLGDKKGMGAAYIRAFSAIADSYDVIITMDADFSHPPEMIPQFLDEIEAGCDVVIGSRYVRGGGVPDWPAQRRFLSLCANVLARVVAGLHPVQDCTSSYRAVKASVLRKVPLQSLSTQGYDFVITLLWEYQQQNTRICEIPFIFRDRKRGETKLQITDIVKFFLNCFRLRLKSLIH